MGLFDTDQVRAAGAVKVPFGKYRNTSLGTIAEKDVLYLDWLVGVKIEKRELREAVELLCQVHAAEIDRAIEERSR